MIKDKDEGCGEENKKVVYHLGVWDEGVPRTSERWPWNANGGWLVFFLTVKWLQVFQGGWSRSQTSAFCSGIEDSGGLLQWGDR